MPTRPLSAPPRLTTRLFPPYAHRPGTTPHPINDPRGHSYHTPGTANHPVPAVIPVLDAPSLTASETYRYGIDLYNAGFWWEAHEEWESLWNIARGQGPAGKPAALFLRGLIQAAAFQLKVTIHERPGCERLLARLSANFAPVMASIAPARHFAGVDVPELVASLQAQLSRPETGRPEAAAGPFEFIVLESPTAPVLRQ